MMAAELKLVLEWAHCTQCEKAFSRTDPEETECYECWQKRQEPLGVAAGPPDEPEQPQGEPEASTPDSDPNACFCRKKSHEGICWYRASHLEEGSRKRMLEEMVEAVQGLEWGEPETSDVFRAAVLLLLSVKWSTDKRVLQAIARYPTKFIERCNHYLRKGGVWRWGGGYNVEWLREGMDGGEFSVALMLDAMVAIGQVGRFVRPDGPYYQALNGGFDSPSQEA